MAVVPARRLGAAAVGLSRCRQGASAIELALLTPVLLLLMLGMIDLGRGFETRGRLESAARAGAQYATQDAARASDTAGIETAARRDARAANDASVSVSSATSCSCPSGTAVACGGTCSGNAPRRHVSVFVSQTFQPMFPFASKLAGSIQLTGRAVMRVE